MMIKVIDTPPEFVGYTNDTKVGSATVRVREMGSFKFPENIINYEGQVLELTVTDVKT